MEKARRDARRGNPPIKKRSARTLKKKGVISAVKNEQCRGNKKKRLDVKTVIGRIFSEKVYYQISIELPRRKYKIVSYKT